MDGKFQKVYTGQAHDHPFTLTDKAIGSGTKLTGTDAGTADPDADYEIQSHDHANHYTVGSYPMVILGKGNYTGSRTETFTILPKEIVVGEDSTRISLTYGYAQSEWETQVAELQKKANEQIVTKDQSSLSIRLYVDDVLNAGNDQSHLHYEFTDASNTSLAGNYTVTVKGKVNVAKMDIGQTGNVTVTPGQKEAQYTGQALDVSIHVVDKLHRALQVGTDYEVTYLYHGVDGTNTAGTQVQELKEAGEYTIAVKAKDTSVNYTGENKTAKFTITAPVADTYSVTPKKASVEYTGSAQQPGVTVLFGGSELQENTDYTLSYTANTDVGMATITVTGVPTGAHKNLKQTVSFEITPKAITDSMVSLNPTEDTYTGSAIVPTVTVTDGQKTLQAGVDYTVSYTRNNAVVSEMKDAAEYKVVVTGKGNYKSEGKQTFTIKAANLSDPTTGGGKLDVQVYPSTGVFDGTDHKSKIKLVVTFNDIVLDPARDYTVSYQGSDGQPASQLKDVGTYTITVTGRANSNYTGTASATYTITDASASGGQALTVELSQDSFTYNGSEQKPTVTVKDGNTALGTGEYDIKWPTDSTDAGQKVVTVTGKGNYNGRNGFATYTIQPKDITSQGTVTVDSISDQTYTGQQLTPQPTVKDGNKNLSLGRDYTLSYGPNVNVGTGAGSVIIRGTGNYTGEKTVTFNIVAASIVDPGTGGDPSDPDDPTKPNAGFSVDVYPASAPYTNKAHTPTVVVHFNGQLLTQDTDYTVTYEKTASGPELESGNMVQVGEYVIKVTGKGNYQGELQAAYEITAASADVVLEVGKITSATYTGSEQTPTLVVTAYTDGGKSSQELTEDQYSVSWSSASKVDAGVYLVTVTGKETYAGLTATGAFVINPKDVGEQTDPVSVDVADDALVYDGTAKEPTVNATYKSVSLKDDADYILVYAGNIQAGTDSASVTLYGRGNYTGSVEKKFSIGKAGDGLNPNPGDDPADPSKYAFRVEVYPSTGVYTAAKHQPLIQVVDNNTNRILDAGEYELSGHDNMVDIKSYTITATAKDGSNYTGQATATYEITAPTQSAGELQVKLTDKGPFVYSGEEQEPAVSVEFGGKQLQEGTDYTVSYSGNTNAGTATVTVTGVSTNYKGMTGTANFTIAPKDIASKDVQASCLPQDYTGYPIYPDVVVQDFTRKTVLTLNTDYTLEYRDNVGPGTGTVTVQGIGNYTSTVEVTFTISVSGSLWVEGIESAYTYTGTSIKPTPTVTEGQGGRPLQVGLDYEVAYYDGNGQPVVNPLNVGEYEVVVTGLGAYAGQEATKTFTIQAKLLHLDVEVNPSSAAYEDSDQLSASVELGGAALNDSDYTLYYQMYREDGTLSNAEALILPADTLKAAGMYVITAQGANGYKDAMGTATFVRLPAKGTLTPDIPSDVGDEGAQVNPDSGVITMTYNGKNRVSVLNGITVEKPDGTAATVTKVEISYNSGAATDVTNTVNSYNMTNAGVYTVTYTAAEGSSIVVVVINPKDINDATIGVTGLEEDAYTYNGAEQSPNKVQLTDSEYAAIAQTTDYTVQEVSETNAGTYQVKIQGVGNYTGVRYGNFIINQKPLTVAGVGSHEYVFGYAGPIDLAEGKDFTVTGVVNSDDVTAAVRVPAGLGAGGHTIIPELSGTAANNYTVSGGVDVTVKPLDATDPDGDGKPGTDTDGDGNSDPDPDKGDNDGDGVVDPDKDGDNDGFIEDEDGDGTIVTTGGFTVKLSPTEGDFTGTAHIPSVTVTYQPDGQAAQVLKEGTDYTVRYLDANGNEGQMIQVGSYTVRVELTGNYKGGFDLGYTINPGSGTDPDNPDQDTDNDGSIEDGDNDGTIHYGGYTVTMSPTKGYHNGQPHNPKVKVTFTVNGTAVALIEDVDFTVSYYNSANTLVTEMVDVGTYTVRVTGRSSHTGSSFDLSYTIEATPTGGGGGGGGGSTVRYTIQADAGRGGSISPSGSVNVVRGDNKTFRITADEGYEIADVLVDGESVGAVSRYVFENVREDHTIQVEFRKAEEGKPGVADPSVTGVDRWLNVTDHAAYLSGYPDGSFGADRSMTRAEAAQMFYALLQDKNVAVTVSFQDVPSEAWYAKAVNTLASLGMVSGVGEGRFEPDRAITRAEFATIAVGFAYLENGGQNIFSDVSAGDWFYPYVVTCVQYGWIGGYPDGTFRPNNTITRAEVTTIVNNMLARAADTSYVDSHTAQLVRFGDVSSMHWAYYQIMEAANGHTYSKVNGQENWRKLLG